MAGPNSPSTPNCNSRCSAWARDPMFFGHALARLRQDHGQTPEQQAAALSLGRDRPRVAENIHACLQFRALAPLPQTLLSHQGNAGTVQLRAEVRREWPRRVDVYFGALP